MTSVFAEGPGLTAQENTVLSFTMDTINQRQWKLKHFIFLPYQRTLAYSSLLEGDKILLLTGLIGGCLATHEATCNRTKWTPNIIVLISSTVYPFHIAANYITCKVSLS